MYKALELENATGSRRVPTEFALVIMAYTVIYIMMINQIWGRSVVKPIQVISIPIVSVSDASTMPDDRSEDIIASPAAGISKFIHEIPMAPIESILPKIWIRHSSIDQETETEEVPLSWEEGMTVATHSFREEEVVKLAILIEGEGGGLESLTELSEIAWNVVNRIYYSGCPDNVIGVITQEGQFDGYTEGGTYSERSYWMANDVLARFERELQGEENVGRTLPKEYLFFYGDGVHNYYSIKENGAAYAWFPSMESPYVS